MFFRFLIRGLDASVLDIFSLRQCCLRHCKTCTIHVNNRIFQLSSYFCQKINLALFLLLCTRRFLPQFQNHSIRDRGQRLFLPLSGQKLRFYKININPHSENWNRSISEASSADILRFLRSCIQALLLKSEYFQIPRNI